MSRSRPGEENEIEHPWPLRQVGWRFPAAVFLFVLVLQLWLVARAGTDIPFWDQWGIEGAWLYPRWIDGTFDFRDWFVPFNEHRIVWTHLLNLLLFATNGQWDPVVELVAIAGLRAGCATLLAWLAARVFSARAGRVVAVAVGIAFLPHLAWHNVLWGIESHAYFVLGFSLLALVFLGADNRSWSRTLLGLAAGAAALLAMGPGAIVPVALLGLALLKLIAAGRKGRAGWQLVWPAALLLAAAMSLRVTVPEHAELAAHDARQFLVAAGRMLAWPHVGQPLASIPLNLPLVFLAVARLTKRRRGSAADDLVLLVGGWSVGIALATAWTRGGSPELIAGVPSRYVDFIVLLPLANLGAAGLWVSDVLPRWRTSARLLGAAWVVFLLAGWIGLSAETWRGVVGPRIADRAAPIRLARAFQLSENPLVFQGQPRLLVPHPNLAAVSAVLHDPRLAGKLPPSFQPERPLGPLSRAARWLLRQ